MKFFFLLLASCCLLFLSGCQRDDAASSPQALSSLLQSGPWEITAFSQDGNDRLYYFGGYRFTFSSNSSVTADKAGATALGNWSVTTQSTTSKLFFQNFSSSPFDELNEDWQTQQVTSGLIRLQHVSGGNGGTDLLTFERR